MSIESRRRPSTRRRIESAFADQVPSVVEAYLTLLTKQAAERFDEAELDHVLSRMRDGFAVEHLATRDEFEAAFAAKRAFPAEIRIDEGTDRVYLVGVGLPGREELGVERVPVRNRYGETVGYELETTSRLADDTLLTYVEISWRELREAEERTSRWPELVREKVAEYFQLPEHLLTATVLACHRLTDSDFHGIAHYVLQHTSTSTHSYPGS